MNQFQRLFGSGESQGRNSEKIDWISLVSSDQLTTIREQSREQMVLLFKHSTRCGISRSVIKQFENRFDHQHINCVRYYLDLLNYRSISNELSSIFDVEHQSPQLLIIKNETAVFHASHYDIIETDLTRFV